MGELTQEDLGQLTETVNRLLSEFDCGLPVLSVGVVRLVNNAITEHLHCKSVALQALRSQIDDVDALAKRQADFDAVVAELKRMAMGGIMPRMTTWDGARPTELPRAQAIVNRYQKSWGQLAEIAGLRMDKKETDSMRPVAHLNGTFNE